MLSEEEMRIQLLILEVVVPQAISARSNNRQIQQRQVVMERLSFESSKVSQPTTTERNREREIVVRGNSELVRNQQVLKQENDYYFHGINE